MRKYVAEFIGAFGLVFTFGCTVLAHAALAPLAIGAVLMVLVYAGGHISGAHYNPAVSLAAFLRGALTRKDMFPYRAAQLLGALIAAPLARFVINPAAVAALSLSGRAVAAALLAEFLFTFGLAYVVLNVATSKDHPTNSFYGLAIGFTSSPAPPPSAASTGPRSTRRWRSAPPLWACCRGRTSGSTCWPTWPAGRPPR